jgi:hypothetical protein
MLCWACYDFRRLGCRGTLFDACTCSACGIRGWPAAESEDPAAGQAGPVPPGVQLHGSACSDPADGM